MRKYLHLMTEKQVHKKIKKLHKKNPILANILADPEFDQQDCIGCQINWVGYKYGWENVSDFDSLMDWHYLLGTKP